MAGRRSSMTVPQSSLTPALRTVVRCLPRRLRVELAFLPILMVAAAFAEMASIGAMVPLLAVLVDPALLLQRPWAAKLLAFLDVTDANSLRWRLTLAFAAVALIANAIRMALVHATCTVNFGIAHRIGAELFQRTLHQPYEVHVATNSSEVIANLSRVDNVVWIILAILNTCSAAVMSLFIVASLLAIDALMATVALVGFGAIFALSSLLTHRRLNDNSHVINSAYGARVQCVQEGLGAIRDVLLDHSQQVFVRRYTDVDQRFRQAQASNSVIAAQPRFIVEALGMVLIAFLAYYLTSAQGGVGAVIPALGALALGAQRLLPLLQQLYQGWALIKSQNHLILEVTRPLERPVADRLASDAPPLPFEREIRFERVGFRYQPHLPPVLQEIDLTIPRGSRIGICGPTGSGKSTAMDLLLGLLQPTDGRITVDGIALAGAERLRWQRNIAHVPQAIFLADASFAENIAFACPREQIDRTRVLEAARQAQIHEFIESTPSGYDTRVGERGVRLSGGQRQRVAIARALYKQAKVLVFDEATSALDSETEAEVMRAIESLGRELTIVLIAHRTTTLRNCDLVYRLDKGKLVNAGTYQALFPAHTIVAEASRTSGSRIRG